MSLTFSCPHCQRVITVADKYAGQRGRCPSCSNPVTVPAAEAASASPLDDSTKPAAAASPAPVASAEVAAASGTSHYHEADDHHHEHDEDDGERHSFALLPKKDEEHEDLIDMTPMVDIVFFLLIFFLTTTLTAVQAVMNLPKPEKATEGGGAAKSVSDLVEDKDTLMVKIHEDDTFWIDDEQYFSDQDLRIRIRQGVAEASRPLALVVVGNADASYGAAIRVIDAGADAKVGSVSLLVQEVTDD